MKKTGYQEIRLKHQIAPLIDVVFLLLIYFMVTATLIRKEGDIAFSLPVRGPSVDWPVEAYIQITDSGDVLLEGMHFESTDRELQSLAKHISSLREMADAQQSEFIVTLAPSDHTLHRRLIEVIDACKDARVRHLAFAQKKS